MASEAHWPLTREQHELLVMLASMIRRFGAERFLEVALVRADKRDFPDAWDGTVRAVHQLIYRLCWHAYLDPEVIVRDLRGPFDESALLVASEIEIAQCTAGVVTFDVHAIGNDDIAGTLAHAIGEVFLDLAPGEPFRSTPRVPDVREASVAAVFLGLGVPAANAAMYRRHAAEIRGRSEYSESKLATAGGLDIADITLLVAIQDLLRDEVQDALTTLHGPQKDWIEQWKDVLDPHEDELRDLLGLDDPREPSPLSRGAAPRVAPAHDEDARKRVNVGAEVLRVRDRTVLGVVGGSLLGAVPFLFTLGAGGAGVVIGLATTIAGTAYGWLRWSQPYFTCGGATCGRSMKATDTTCPHCGGMITRTVTPKELAAHWKQLREEADARDELIDESEFAGDPDADVLASQRARPPRATARTRHRR